MSREKPLLDKAYKNQVHRLLDTLSIYTAPQHKSFTLSCDLALHEGCAADARDTLTRRLYNQLLAPLNLELPAKISFGNDNAMTLELGNNSGIRLLAEYNRNKDRCSLFIDRKAFEKIAEGWDYVTTLKLKDLDSAAEGKPASVIEPSPDAERSMPFVRPRSHPHRH